MKWPSIIKIKPKTVALVAIALTAVLLGRGAVGQSVNDYKAVPPLLAESAKPLIMLALSNDHQLFYKAFTDYDDLSGNGMPDTTYDNDIEYVGYFDSFKCYVYDDKLSYFSPVAYTPTRYCNRQANNQWSGNFLNWLSMTRIDQVRKVLFGGYRYNESAYSDKTILERAILPNDAHSFAKYYNGMDLPDLTPFGGQPGATGFIPIGLPSSQSGITFCNTTKDTDSTTSNSSRVNAPPLIRAVAGNYTLWNANERWQCLYTEEQHAYNNNDPGRTGINAHSTSPSMNDQATQRDGKTVGDYVARVEVCKSDLVGSESCKQYPNGNYKPVGILQRFGDTGQVEFGMMTGSYAKNKSGGVLRKDIGPMTDEINTATDGSFVTGKGGIIETINLFRIANYDYSDGTYNELDSCPWDSTSFADGTCTNWGNPFSGIMLECYRYFAGKQPNPNFDADDGAIIPGLKRITKWNDPLDKENACAQLNVIAFNASSNSYDSAGLGGFSDLNPVGGATAKSMTDKVGDGEGITGTTPAQQFFVGEHGSDNDQLCTAKAITGLGDVRGTCPDAPRLEGSYQMAGIAYHARINDIRPDLPEKQTVRTYGVTLAPTVPNMVVPVPGSDNDVVKILPACRATMTDGSEGNCGLVDFKVVENYVPTGNPNEYRGSFYVNWEDNEQGGDYDMDMYGMIRYVINSATIKVETEVVHMDASIKLGFGFVISGTTSDGFNVFSGINEYTGFDCDKCRHHDPAKSKTFTIGSSVASLLEQPLFYAAKWGGFIDKDGDGKPGLPEEWDSRVNATGALGSDGLPDTYFLATNPRHLESQLSSILVNILERTASGTSAAVVTNTGSGEGALYQALYNPRFAAADGIDSVEWVGTLNALFVDRYGYIREDNAEPFGALTDDDHIVDVYYDSVSKKTLIQRYLPGTNGELGEPVEGPVDVLNIKPIWGAREELAKVEDYALQRPYREKASKGRYILTGIDRDGDGQIGMGADVPEVFPFEASVFNPDSGNQHFRLLGLTSDDRDEAQNIVNYIRGEPIPGYRNRRIDINGDGSIKPVLLGDIVHSSPVAVGRPSSAYDLTFGDDTYRRFRQTYQNRRQMVYVGANDGKLHAFNAGFFNSAESRYELKVTNETEHPLGSEVWSYVPYNLLPHLRWLTRPDYPHVYYVDGVIKHYDVNIFPDSETHPGGWGTILVVGMRFGGGDYTLNLNGDPDGDPSNETTLRSGYVVLDITDPERPPTVLAELTHPDMGYTVAEPTLVKMRKSNQETGSYATPDINQWYLVFGSGPAGATAAGREAALQRGVSDKTAKLFVYDLKRKMLETVDTGEEKAFIGGIHTVDWTRDFIDNAVYFGSVGGSVENPTGKLHRGELGLSGNRLTISVSDLLDVADKPFSATPLTVRDRLGDYWVYSGTGRFYVVEDNLSTKKQAYYGIKEPQKEGGQLTGTRVRVADLINTTDISVFADGSIDSKSSPGTDIHLGESSVPAKTFTDVYGAVQNADGWMFDLTRYRSRNITQAVVSDQSLVFTEYEPSGLRCEPEGLGFLNAPHLQAGIPGVFAPLGTDSSSMNSAGAEEVNLGVELGYGSPSAPSVHQRGDGKKVAIVQSSTGELSTTVIHTGSVAGRRESWRELIIDWE